MILETVSVGSLEVNCYLLAAGDGRQAVIIDPGAEERKIKRVLDKHKLKAGIIINTHGHIDHIGCDDKFNVPVYVHKEDLLLLKDPGLNLSSCFALPFTVSSKVHAVVGGEIINLDGI